MSQNYRLDNIGLINRDKKLSFKFNGVTYSGYEGEHPSPVAIGSIRGDLIPSLERNPKPS